MRLYQSLIFVVLLALCSFFAVTSDVFLSWANFFNILTATSTIGLLAIGAAFVIGSNGIDLSVGSVMALSAIIGVSVVNVTPLPLASILIGSFATGIVVGVMNGWLIGRVKLPPFIVTLGMLSIARGLALTISSGKPIYGLPESLVSLGQGEFLGIPIPVIFFLSACLMGHLALRFTKFGRYSITVGDNEMACRNAGVSILRYKIAVYAFSGFLAALAGVISMSRINAADPSMGVMYELTAITAAIIGGTSLSGGRTSVLGAMIGALIMGVLQNGMTLLNVPAYYQQVAVGLVLIFAVVIGQGRGLHAVEH